MPDLHDSMTGRTRSVKRRRCIGRKHCPPSCTRRLLHPDAPPLPPRSSIASASNCCTGSHTRLYSAMRTCLRPILASNPASKSYCMSSCASICIMPYLFQWGTHCPLNDYCPCPAAVAPSQKPHRACQTCHQCTAPAPTPPPQLPAQPQSPRGCTICRRPRAPNRARALLHIALINTSLIAGGSSQRAFQSTVTHPTRAQQTHPKLPPTPEVWVVPSAAAASPPCSQRLGELSNEPTCRHLQGVAGLTGWPSCV
jgi:hypothetical protein